MQAKSYKQNHVQICIILFMQITHHTVLYWRQNSFGNEQETNLLLLYTLLHVKKWLVPKECRTLRGNEATNVQVLWTSIPG